MLHIVLNPAVFHPVTGKGPFKGMSAIRQANSFYVMESSGSEIGIIPFSPPLRNNPQRPTGQNSFRTINISLNPIEIDETLIAKSYIQNQGYLINKIIAAVADGIIEVRQNANATPMTAAALSTLFFG